MNLDSAESSALSSRLLAALWLMLAHACLAQGALAQSAGQDDLRVGHWAIVKGALDDEGRFVAEAIEIAAAAPEEFVQGAVEAFASNGSWIEILGQRISLTRRVRWRGDVRDSLKPGARVKVEGHYRGLQKFSARSVAARGGGRDRIAGRVDAVRREGGQLEFDLMRFLVLVPGDIAITSARALGDYELTSARALSREEAFQSASGRILRDDEDYIPGSIRITNNLQFGLRAEYRNTTELDFDLRGNTAEDRIDDFFNLRGVLVWTPLDRLLLRFAGSANMTLRQDEEDGYERTGRQKITEAYGYWSALFGLPLDLQVGRQDFYDKREWIWDHNLDGVRLHYHPGDWRLELSASTTLSDGSPREEETTRLIAHISHERENRYLGAYFVDQRTRFEGRDYPFFFGLQAAGEWLTDNNVWGELAAVRGYEDDTDLVGWGLDFGTTWSPQRARPWYFSAGYAFGSGDDNPTDGADHAFRQSGIQDNNDKAGGVTAYRYYGELFEPELSNLHIQSLGIGRRFGRQLSLDLVYHRYTQDKAQDALRDTSLDLRPNGNSRDIGHELDFILGHRGSNGLDTEVVLAAFDPGAAFDDARRAYLLKFQLRYRF